jgi:hypothetical protein
MDRECELLASAGSATAGNVEARSSLCSLRLFTLSSIAHITGYPFPFIHFGGILLICISDYWNLHSEGSRLLNSQAMAGQNLLPRSDTHTSGHGDVNFLPNPLSSEPTWSFDGTTDRSESPLPLVHRRPVPLPQHGSDSYAEEYQAGEEIRMRRQARRQRLATAPLGTVADVQDPTYESPLAGMMSRAWGRYREAEERRTSVRRTANDADNADGSNILRLRVFASESSGRTPWPQNILREEPDPTAINPIDAQDRPTSVPPEKLKGNIGCTICHEQVIDTLLEPCMHVSVCRWCAEIMQNRAREARQRMFTMSPVAFEETIWRCPVCRLKVQQTRRVFLGLS